MLEVGEGLQPAVLLKRDLVALERLGVGQLLNGVCLGAEVWVERLLRFAALFFLSKAPRPPTETTTPDLGLAHLWAPRVPHSW